MISSIEFSLGSVLAMPVRVLVVVSRAFLFVICKTSPLIPALPQGFAGFFWGLCCVK